MLDGLFAPSTWTIIQFEDWCEESWIETKFCYLSRCIQWYSGSTIYNVSITIRIVLFVCSV